MLTEYESGVIVGMAACAWWKDGTRFVGTTGSTFADAVWAFLAQRGGFTEDEARYLARLAALDAGHIGGAP